jgi:hypothetical protein
MNMALASGVNRSAREIERVSCSANLRDTTPAFFAKIKDERLEIKDRDGTRFHNTQNQKRSTL